MCKEERKYMKNKLKRKTEEDKLKHRAGTEVENRRTEEERKQDEAALT